MHKLVLESLAYHHTQNQPVGLISEFETGSYKIFSHPSAISIIYTLWQADLLVEKKTSLYLHVVAEERYACCNESSQFIFVGCEN